MIKLFYCDAFYLPLPPDHQFPMEKYPSIKKQLISEGTFTEQNFVEPTIVDYDIVALTHNEDYLQKLESGTLSKAEIRRSGFPYSKAMVKREWLITSATVNAIKPALADGVSFNLAGGTHHAFADHAEGFCIFNDIAVAANHYINTNKSANVLIVDLDVHQGNGTAQIFKDEPRVFTFSMHGEKNFPLRKQTSDLDIPLPETTNDLDYLKILKDTLPGLINKTNPEIVFYQAGVDLLVQDKLGKVNMTIQGCYDRDLFVFDTLKKTNTPVVVTMGGGYSEQLNDIVEAHCNTYRIAKERYQ